MIPASLGLFLLGKPIVAVLFERGEFQPSDTLWTAQNLAGYVVGLWAYALVYLFSRAFYALGRPSLPLLGAALSLFVNIGLNLWWVRIWGTFGLALATGVAGWVDALFLGALLWRRIRGWIPWSRLSLVLLGSAAMGFCVWAVSSIASPLGSWAQVLLGVGLGVTAYGVFAQASGLLAELRAG
jgi:putative peptidoglycan lipid II flippase